MGVVFDIWNFRPVLLLLLLFFWEAESSIYIIVNAIMICKDSVFVFYIMYFNCNCVGRLMCQLCLMTNFSCDISFGMDKSIDLRIEIWLCLGW